jgi:CDP-4-dehydro-6-deoxyglucose reductase
MLAESFRARLVGRRRLSPKVHELTLELAEPVPFHWLAGQYVLIGTDASADRYAFSIASHDDQREPARFLLAVGEGSTAEPVLAAGIGSELDVLGPHGSFTWHPAPGALLVGVGTGVAPLKALVEEALARGFAGPLLLLAGFRSSAELLWPAEFAELARENPRFRFVPTLSQPLADWSGRRGRVQEHLYEFVSELPARSAAYVCGKTAMFESCREALASWGVAPEDVRSESY